MADTDGRRRLGGLQRSLDRRRWLIAIAVTVAVVVLAPLLLNALMDDDGPEAARESVQSGSQTARVDDSAGGTSTPVPAATSGTSTSTSTTAVSTTLATPIPTAPPGPPIAPAASYKAGKLVLRGSVPTAATAAAYRTRFAGVIGAENVTSEMTIDPRVTATSLSVDIEESFQFPAGTVVYDPEFDALLTLGAFALKLLPESTLVVTGHTDSVGDEGTNMALSVARAELIRDFMIRGGIAPGRVVARGAGETQPVADNATPEGRQANRRIEAMLEGVRPTV